MAIRSSARTCCRTNPTHATISAIHSKSHDKTPRRPTVTNADGIKPTPALKSTFQKSESLTPVGLYRLHSRGNVFGPEPKTTGTTPVNTPLPTANVACSDGRTSVFRTCRGAGRSVH